MKDKERIENCRLRERTGGYHKYVDSAQVHNPDPISSHFVSESDRFDKDFAVADQRVRAQQFEAKQNKYAHLRQERFDREAKRFDDLEATENKDVVRLQAKKDHFNAGRKNQGGAAYNLLNLEYDQTTQG